MPELIKKTYHSIDIVKNAIYNAKLNPMSNTNRLSLSLGVNDEGFIAYDKDLDNFYFWNGTTWKIAGVDTFLGLLDTPNAYTGTTGYVLRVNSGETGVEFHLLTKSDLGLGNVDNTSDINKPISTDTQTALDLKADKVITFTATGSGIIGGGDLSTDRTISLDLPYFDNNYVTLATDQTISGQKTFTGGATTFTGSQIFLNGFAQIDISDGMPITWHKTSDNSFMGWIQDNQTDEFQIETATGVHATIYTKDLRLFANTGTKFKIGANSAAAQALDVVGTIRQSAVTSSLLKANSSGDLIAAISGVDYAPAIGGSYEPIIASGTTAQYWRGDKTWQNLNTSIVPENTNLYFTTGRVNTQVATYTGDITMSGGIFTIGVSKVTNAMLAGSITNDKLVNSSVTVTAGTGLSGGGTVSLGGAITLTSTITQYTDSMARLAISNTTIGLTYTNTTGVLSLTSGYVIPTTTEESNWNIAYNRSGVSLGFTASTLTFTKQDASTLTISVPTFNQNTTGSAATLTTPRNIQGVAFNGSTNIDIINGAGFIKASGTTISYDNSTYLTTIAGIAAGGELSGTYSNPSLVNSAVISKILTGLNLTGGGSISATDSILQAFGKVQNQISGILGAVQYQGVWNATSNSPTITSSTGTKGYYYVVNVAGTTSIDGILDWKIGDWIIFNGSTWDKVDNTDAVSSVNGFVGAVSLPDLTISTGLQLNTGTTYNGSLARTISIDSTVVTLTGSQVLTNKTIAAGSNTISGLTNSNLSGSAGITNTNLANSSITIGSTSISLGATSTTLAGLTSVTSTTFVGALTGNASTATNVAASGVTSPAALTKTDDTNVTLTLGGTPSTALLVATSLTLGWTGTLSVARGGTGGSAGAILNQTSQQASSNFNISNAAVIGTTLTVTGAATIQTLNIGLGGGSITSNTAIGVSAMQLGTLSGGGNTVMGYQAGLAMTGGVNVSVIIGYQAAKSLTTGGGNTVIGASAYLNGTGTDNVILGNSAVGGTAGASNSNVVIGESAANSLGAGARNVVIGYQAMQNMTGGTADNVAIGTGTMLSASGGSNTAVGKGALSSGTVGSGNTAIGMLALNKTATTGSNIGIGYTAGAEITTGANNVVIGSYTAISFATASNAIYLADGAGNLRVMIPSTGNVLINTTTDDGVNKLQVTGSVIFTSTLTISGLASGSAGNFVVNGGSGLLVTRTAVQVLSDIGAASSTATFTLGSTSIALGSTTTTVVGLASVTSTTFVGALTGNATTVTNGVYTTGTQSIGGAKTFTNQVTITDGSNTYQLVVNASGHTSYVGGEFIKSPNFLLLNESSGFYGQAKTATLTTYRTYTFKDADGTVAFTSDLSSYLPLAGGTMSGAINMAGQNITNGGTATFNGIVNIGLTGSTTGALVIRTGVDQRWRFKNASVGQLSILDDAEGSYQAFQLGNNWLGFSSNGNAVFSNALGVGGVSMSSPVGILANTAVNTLGSDNQGNNTNSLAWGMSAVGYVATFWNGNNATLSNGLAVKIASNLSTSVAFDVSQHTAQGTQGNSLFKITGDGLVKAGLGTFSSGTPKVIWTAYDNSAGSGTAANVTFDITQTTATTGSTFAACGAAYATNTSGVVAAMAGGSFSVQMTGSGGTITDAKGVNSGCVINNGTITTWSAFKANAPAVSGGGSIGTKYSFLGQTNAGILNVADGGIFGGPLGLAGYTVATLPAGSIGQIAYVTDALTPSFLVVVVGGGSTKSPVFHNGTNWVVF